MSHCLDLDENCIESMGYFTENYFYDIESANPWVWYISACLGMFFNTLNIFISKVSFFMFDRLIHIYFLLLMTF